MSDYWDPHCALLLDSNTNLWAALWAIASSTCAVLSKVVAYIEYSWPKLRFPSGPILDRTNGNSFCLTVQGLVYIPLDSRPDQCAALWSQLNSILCLQDASSRIEATGSSCGYFWAKQGHSAPLSIWAVREVMNTVLPEWVRPVTQSRTGEPKTVSIICSLTVSRLVITFCLTVCKIKPNLPLFSDLDMYLSVQTSV